MKHVLPLLLALGLIVTLAACGSTAHKETPPKATEKATDKTTDKTNNGTADDPVPAENEEAAPLLFIHPAKDNAEVLAALKSIGEGRVYGRMKAVGGLAADDVAEAEAAAPMPEPMAADGAVYNGAQEDFSGTNVQVKGVDEGDIVKTDGRYIYALRGQELLILSADGTDSKVLFRKTVGVDRYQDYEKTEGKYMGSEGENRNPVELYILGDRLAVLYSENHWSDRCDEKGNWSYIGGQTTITELFDASDPSSPVLTESFAQDGYYRTSRLTDGRLYVLSDYWVNDPDADEPESYIPQLYTGDTAWNMPAERIWIPERGASACYTVVSGLDVASGTRTGSLSVLGGSDTVYMTADKLYIASGSSREEKSEPRTEEIYTVTDYSYTQETALTCISLAGEMTVTASGRIEGNLLNQFSMDEYKGYLRLVTTESGYSYTIYEDTKRGFVNYKYPEEQRKQTNGLYVLDDALNVVGSLTGLAEEEQVYSVRFDGDTGYFVTFRQTDPLFAVDLSEPTAPKMLSALKIPGFSEYLHVYGEGRLFGLGMNADEETGRTDTMKLSMFDTSDPANVTEKHVLKLKESWSEALYNHKAILISPEKDIIAFPAGNGYEIYGYSDSEGFYLRGRIEGDSDAWWNGSARGLYIGETGYVVLTDRMWVLDLNEMTMLCDVVF